MANDREILREIWEGKLPVCFKLDSSEVYDLQQPEPFFLMVPRLSYFPLVIDKVRKHFSRYVDNEKQEQEMWLEYNGQPLKWHFPIGVIFDLYVGSDIQLPWNITVHFDKFPESQIFREIVEAYFMACIKEADFLKHRGQVVSSMQKKDHNQLWVGLQNDKFDQFWAVNRKLMEALSDQEHFKYIPFRLYIDDGYRQKLIKPVAEDGKLKIRTHGMIPPMDTPIQWMSEHLSYPDNFLH
ncbi:hypothetical protein FQA39_LY00440, partial [Lamprigera yunnana]